MMRRSAFRPMLSEPKSLAIFRKKCVDVPSTLRMMSPATIPACAAGPPSTTDMTIKPLGWSAASRSASGTATACKATPSQPRAMPPSSSSNGTMRSMVGVGMTMTWPRGPKVDMPKQAPAASKTGPPSSRRARRRSSTMRRSMRPPRLLCHSAPARLTTPSRALAPPIPSAPTASATAAVCASPADIDGDAIGSAGLRIAILVLGSRPAILGRQDRAACRDKYEIIFSRQRLLGDDDNPVSPHHTRDMPPVCEADSDDRIFRNLRAHGQSVRELG